MSRYRNVEIHLKQLRELQSIISSMKTLSQLELRKLSRFAESQSLMNDVLKKTLSDFLTFFPRAPVSRDYAVWLLIGSERGFCGEYNELLVNHLFNEWPDCLKHPQRVLAVGRKLSRRLDEKLPGYKSVSGASASEEIPSVLSQVVGAIQHQLTEQSSATLMILAHSDEHRNVSCRQLLPPEEVNLSEKNTELVFPPLMYLDPETFFGEFLQHYLFLCLTRLITVSLLAENRYRTQHLGGAEQRLDERLTALQSRARSLRQEEITEEIEMILLGGGAFHSPHTKMQDS